MVTEDKLINIEVMNYLPFHLVGVLGGVLLHVFSYVIQRYVR